MEIKNLEDLLHRYLDENGKQFLSYECKNLLATGENYGSTMLAVTIKVKNQENQEEVIHGVAKTAPPSKAVWDFFNVSVSFKKEILYYTSVVPTLNEFGEERGINNLIDSCAECFGGRISLNASSDTVDQDAILMLGNLKIKGYTVGDRLTGFNSETAKLILKSMAGLHGSVLAFKFAKPEEFQAKIRPHLGKGMLYVASDTMLDNLVKSVRRYASADSECIPFLSRVEVGIRKMKNLFVYPEIREPLATLIHIDLWTNNVMVKYEGDKPIHNIFIDFPLYEYGSPARDVLFFLYSSVRLDILEVQIDELIQYYYDQLMETLVKLQCDTTIFSFKLFKEEMDEVAKDIEFSHMIYMLTPIFTMGGQAKELTEWSPENLAPLDEEALHRNYHERLYFIVKDYAKRNWI